MTQMIPMPSPSRTNYAREYLPASFPFTNASNPTMAIDAAIFRTSAEAAAYRRKPYGMDAALLPALVEQVLRFVSPKLSPHGFGEVRALLVVNDDPITKGPMASRDLGNNKRVPWTDPNDKLQGPSYGLDSRFPGVGCE